MREKLMKKNYAKAFKMIVALAVLLAVVSAIVASLNLPKNENDRFTAKQEEQVVQTEEENHGLDRLQRLERKAKSLDTANYVALGVVAVLWLVLGVYYWLLVIAWLYKSAVCEGMNHSLWPILGLFTNLLAVFLFLIVRDNPRRVKIGNE